jgi:hypothetical protein
MKEDILLLWNVGTVLRYFKLTTASFSHVLLDPLDIITVAYLILQKVVK